MTAVRREYAATARLEGRRRIALGAVAVAAIVVGCCAYVGPLDSPRLRDGVPALFALIAEMWPPDFGRAGSWVILLLDTLAMSVAGTASAVTHSIPIGFAAAPNTPPHPVLRAPARKIPNGLRAVPKLIMGIVIVAAVGFRTLPVVLALGLHPVGMVGKFFAEAIERASPAPIAAARAVGAAPVQVIVPGMLAQLISQPADVSIYRWEHSFPAATVLELVGAGGIGFQLIATLRALRYRQVSATMLVILATVTVVAGLSGRPRRVFI